MKRILCVGLLLCCAPAWAQFPVTIYVVDSQNAPVAGAQVEALPPWGQKWNSNFGATDAKGDIRLDLPRAASGSAPITAVVAAPGFAFSKIDLTADNGAIQLEKGLVWRGQVVDEAGQPLAGAEVSVIGAEPAMVNGRERGPSLYGTSLQPTFTTKTTATGSFEIAGVPASSLTVRVTLTGFVDASERGLKADKPGRFVLVPGAVVSGRVLGLDGKPLAGVGLMTQDPKGVSGSAKATSRDDGTFLFDTLATGVFNVVVETPSEAPYVVVAAQNVRAERGKPMVLPDMQAIPGVVVRGRVRDITTGEPVAGASVNLYGPTRPSRNYSTLQSSPTGPDGVFSMRVAPGSNQFNLAVAGTYFGVGANRSQTVDVGDQPPAELVYNIEKLAPLSGVFMDERGKPIAARMQLGYIYDVQSGADGIWHFEPGGLLDEKKFHPLGQGDDKGYFEVLSPDHIDLSDPVDTKIVVRKTPWVKLPGRALQSDGTPLEGVTVRVSFTVPQYKMSFKRDSYGMTRSATSDANGDFVVPQLRGSDDSYDLTTKAEKIGFVFRKGGEITRNGPLWQMTDLVFDSLNRSVEGKTAPGAIVVTAGRQTVADAGGHFKVTELPPGNSPVFAALDGQFGGSPLRAPIDITLKKQGMQGVDPALALQIWDEAARDTVKGAERFYVGEQLDLSQFDAGLTWDERLQKARAGGDESLFYLATRRAGEHDLQELEVALGLIIDPEMRLQAYSAVALKKDDVDFGEKVIALRRADLEVRPEAEDEERESELYSLVPLVTKFEGEEAGLQALNEAIDFTLDDHLKIANPNDDDDLGRDDILAQYATTVAEASPLLLKRLIGAIESKPEAGYQTYALAEAIPTLARKFGYTVAMPFFDDLDKLSEGRDATQTFKGGPRDISPQSSFDSAATQVVPLMAGAPNEALKLASRVQGYFQKPRALAAAARFQTGETATRLWTEAVNLAPLEDAPSFAASAWEADPTLGLKLFEIVRDKIESRSKYESDYQGWANYAFHYARVDPAQVRLIIEREWAKVGPAKARAQSLWSDTDDSRDLFKVGGQGVLARAMCAIDGQRALEMAHEMPEPSGYKSLTTRRQIAQYLAMSPEKRRYWSFYFWMKMGAPSSDD